MVDHLAYVHEGLDDPDEEDVVEGLRARAIVEDTNEDHIVERTRSNGGEGLHKNTAKGSAVILESDDPFNAFRVERIPVGEFYCEYES